MFDAFYFIILHAYEGLLKETEIDVSIVAMLHEMWMFGKIIVLRMLKHKKSIFFQQAFFKHKIR